MNALDYLGLESVLPQINSVRRSGGNAISQLGKRGYIIGQIAAEGGRQKNARSHAMVQGSVSQLLGTVDGEIGKLVDEEIRRYQKEVASLVKRGGLTNRKHGRLLGKLGLGIETIMGAYGGAAANPALDSLNKKIINVSQSMKDGGIGGIYRQSKGFTAEARDFAEMIGFSRSMSSFGKTIFDKGGIAENVSQTTGDELKKIFDDIEGQLKSTKTESDRIKVLESAKSRFGAVSSAATNQKDKDIAKQVGEIFAKRVESYKEGSKERAALRAGAAVNESLTGFSKAIGTTARALYHLGYVAGVAVTAFSKVNQAVNRFAKMQMQISRERGMYSRLIRGSGMDFQNLMVALRAGRKAGMDDKQVVDRMANLQEQLALSRWGEGNLIEAVGRWGGSPFSATGGVKTQHEMMIEFSRIIRRLGSDMEKFQFLSHIGFKPEQREFVENYEKEAARMERMRADKSLRGTLEEAEILGESGVAAKIDAATRIELKRREILNQNAIDQGPMAAFRRMLNPENWFFSDWTARQKGVQTAKAEIAQEKLTNAILQLIDEEKKKGGKGEFTAAGLTPEDLMALAHIGDADKANRGEKSHFHELDRLFSERTGLRVDTQESALERVMNRLKEAMEKVASRVEDALKGGAAEKVVNGVNWAIENPKSAMAAVGGIVASLLVLKKAIGMFTGWLLGTIGTKIGAALGIGSAAAGAGGAAAGAAAAGAAAAGARAGWLGRTWRATKTFAGRGAKVLSKIPIIGKYAKPIAALAAVGAAGAAVAAGMGDDNGERTLPEGDLGGNDGNVGSTNVAASKNTAAARLPSYSPQRTKYGEDAVVPSISESEYAKSRNDVVNAAATERPTSPTDWTTAKRGEEVASRTIRRVSTHATPTATPAAASTATSTVVTPATPATETTSNVGGDFTSTTSTVTENVTGITSVAGGASVPTATPAATPAATPTATSTVVTPATPVSSRTEIIHSGNEETKVEPTEIVATVVSPAGDVLSSTSGVKGTQKVFPREEEIAISPIERYNNISGANNVVNAATPTAQRTIINKEFSPESRSATSKALRGMNAKKTSERNEQGSVFWAGIKGGISGAWEGFKSGMMKNVNGLVGAVGITGPFSAEQTSLGYEDWMTKTGDVSSTIGGYALTSAAEIGLLAKAGAAMKGAKAVRDAKKLGIDNVKTLEKIRKGTKKVQYAKETLAKNNKFVLGGSSIAAVSAAARSGDSEVTLPSASPTATPGATPAASPTAMSPNATPSSTGGNAPLGTDVNLNTTNDLLEETRDGIKAVKQAVIDESKFLAQIRNHVQKGEIDEAKLLMAARGLGGMTTAQLQSDQFMHDNKAAHEMLSGLDKAIMSYAFQEKYGLELDITQDYRDKYVKALNAAGMKENQDEVLEAYARVQGVSDKVGGRVLENYLRKGWMLEEGIIGYNTQKILEEDNFSQEELFKAAQDKAESFVSGLTPQEIEVGGGKEQWIANEAERIMADKSSLPQLKLRAAQTKAEGIAQKKFGSKITADELKQYAEQSRREGESELQAQQRVVEELFGAGGRYEGAEREFENKLGFEQTAEFNRFRATDKSGLSLGGLVSRFARQKHISKDAVRNALLLDEEVKYIEEKIARGEENSIDSDALKRYEEWKKSSKAKKAARAKKKEGMANNRRAEIAAGYEAMKAAGIGLTEADEKIRQEAEEVSKYSPIRQEADFGKKAKMMGMRIAQAKGIDISKKFSSQEVAEFRKEESERKERYIKGRLGTEADYEDFLEVEKRVLAGGETFEGISEEDRKFYENTQKKLRQNTRSRPYKGLHDDEPSFEELVAAQGRKRGKNTSFAEIKSRGQKMYKDMMKRKRDLSRVQKADLKDIALMRKKGVKDKDIAALYGWDRVKMYKKLRKAGKVTDKGEVLTGKDGIKGSAAAATGKGISKYSTYQTKEEVNKNMTWDEQYRSMGELYDSWGYGDKPATEEGFANLKEQKLAEWRQSNPKPTGTADSSKKGSGKTGGIVTEKGDSETGGSREKTLTWEEKYENYKETLIASGYDKIAPLSEDSFALTRMDEKLAEWRQKNPKPKEKGVIDALLESHGRAKSSQSEQAPNVEEGAKNAKRDALLDAKEVEEKLQFVDKIDKVPAAEMAAQSGTVARASGVVGETKQVVNNINISKGNETINVTASGEPHEIAAAVEKVLNEQNAILLESVRNQTTGDDTV